MKKETMNNLSLTKERRNAYALPKFAAYPIGVCVEADGNQIVKEMTYLRFEQVNGEFAVEASIQDRCKRKIANDMNNSFIYKNKVVCKSYDHAYELFKLMAINEVSAYHLQDIAEDHGYVKKTNSDSTYTVSSVSSAITS